jgi:hypothetical protein
MFKNSNYDIVNFLPASNGLNTNIAPEILPKEYATRLENMLPTPLGTLSMRFGTALIDDLTHLNIPIDSTIIEAFPFRTVEDKKQIILYLSNYTKDPAQVFNIITGNSFSFNQIDPYTLNNYFVDGLIKIEFTLNGSSGTFYSVISNVVQQVDIFTITLRDNLISDDEINNITINSIYYTVGELIAYDLKSKAYIHSMDKLSTNCVPRCANFLNFLIICNGVDNNIRWNGEHFLELFEFVKEQCATNLTRIDANSFSFTIPDGIKTTFDISKYAVNNYIKIDGIGGDREIRNRNRNGNVVTITTDRPIPTDLKSNASLYYQDFPPPFSFLKVAHNRIWALGSGAVGSNFRAPNQALRVYFSYRSNDLFGFFNETTKTVPSINLAENHGVIDNLEAIIQTDSYLAFVGRERTQIWTGMVPEGALPVPTLPSLTFSSILPVGIVHGNLFIEFDNDVVFVSRNGIKSFSTLNIAKQFSATPIDAINPTAKEYIETLQNDNVAYRACRTFKYALGSFCGFKIGYNKILSSLYSTNVYAWSIFSGDFSKSSTFLCDLDERLYLFINNKIYVYADNQNLEIKYGDNDGKDMIFGVWETPKASFNNRRYVSKMIEMIVDTNSSFSLDKRNNIAIEVDGNLRKTFVLENNYHIEYSGDSLGLNNLGNPLDVNDNAIGFRLGEPYSTLKSRYKFVSSKFSVRVLCSAVNTPLSIKEVNFYGILERKR